MTKKLYDTKPYETKFSAQVISCIPSTNGYDVVLDQTLFFPEEGGQSCDKGTLNGIEVVDVQIHEGCIHHYLSKEINGKVEGKIDWVHRYSNMQNHSGEHILSGLVHSLYGYNNVGFHLGSDEVSADYDGFLNDEQIQNLETKVNEVIMANKTIHCWYPEDVETINYRSKKEIKEAIRIVEIEDVDVCACCAPHVQKTSEVGFFKILKTMKHKKGIRLSFLCGKRAFEHIQTIYQQAQKISVLLSAPIDDIYSFVEKNNKEIYALKQEKVLLQKQKIDSQIQNLEIKDHYILFEDDMDANTQKYYLNQLKPFFVDYGVIFVKQETNYRFLLVSNKDARNQLKQLKDHFPVRGGGKQNNIQGTVEATKEQLLSVLMK